MKTLLRLFMLLATVVFGLVVVVKVIRRCSWQEAAGILEELWKELRSACPMCCCEPQDAAEE
jgi:hypothetical protein